jgi:hypothetical protein
MSSYWRTQRNFQHLEALLNGEIDFQIALVRVNPSIPRRSPADYQDMEKATMLLHQAINVVTRCQKKWSQKEILNWIINICTAALKKMSHGEAKAK